VGLLCPKDDGSVTDSFVPDYLVLVFFASCGVFQIAAACNDLRGLMFFKDRRIAFLFGVALWVTAFAWFFLSEPRNQPDTGLGLTGNQQFGFFFVGAGAGLAFTLLMSSLLNLNLGKCPIPFGLDALRQSNYLRALCGTLQLWAAFYLDKSSSKHKPSFGDSTLREQDQD
jgi:hypothetical protein